jgi:hypothetical protein
MKVGDLIMCIKDRDDYNLKNSVYRIVKINEKVNEISMTVEGSTVGDYCTYRLNRKNEIDNDDHFCFEDHYDLIRFERKEKLKKINKKYEKSN